MEKLIIKDFGPIKSAELELGDLTLIVGPQASGKSLSLELLKLVIDKKHIISTLRNYNYILGKNDYTNILDCYFGDGLASLFGKDTYVEFQGNEFTTKDLLKVKTSDNPKESVFYVPAQRILSMSDGRPRNFNEFDISTPYVLRRFSEILRVFVQGGLGNPDIIFPMKSRLKGTTKNSINKSIFHGAKVVMDASTGQRKMKLQVGEARLPFMAWSAGQKEFMPLLLAFYCLSGPPTQVINKSDYRWVIIEEPEMGLHPKAIESLVLEIMELMQSGYKIIMSTHSPLMMDLVWAIQNVKALDSEAFRKAMSQLFEIKENSTTAHLFDNLNNKEFKVYFSGTNNGSGVTYEDISTLDAFSDSKSVSEWGGLSSFAGRASEIVSEYGCE